MPDVIPDESFLTATDVAKLLGVSDTAVRKRIQNGSIPAEKRGREWRIRRDEIDHLRVLLNDSTEPPNLDRTNRTNHEPLSSVMTEPPNPDRTNHEPLSSMVEVDRLRSENDALRREIEVLQDERNEIRAELKRLHARMEHLEALNERLTLLLANEQAQRLRILPRPLSWFARLLGRR